MKDLHGNELKEIRYRNWVIGIPKDYKVFEIYEYRCFVIRIENYKGSDDLVGFATPNKFFGLIDYFDCEVGQAEEILEEKGFDIYEYDDGELIGTKKGECDYILLSPDEIEPFLARVDMRNPKQILKFMLNRIDEILKENPKESISKEVKKITQNTKPHRKPRPFHHIAWSSMVRLRDKKCTQCGSTHELHAHHIKSYKDYPELRFDVNNGVTLCGNCHRKWHKEHGR